MLEKPANQIAEPGEGWQPSSASPVAHLLLLVGASVGVFLAGGPQDGNVAAFVTMAGAALLIFPPRIRVDWKTWAAASALLLSASLALLPQGWFGVPAWRINLAAAGVPLPTSISPTPRETHFWLAILAIVTCSALFALAHPMRSRMQLALSVLAVAVCGVYATLAIYARQSGWEFPFAADPEEFGFFRNRNHTSTFLVSGSVVALGVLGVSFRNRHWFAGMLAAVCLAVCVAALIFFTKSRGGIASLLGGTLLWVIGLGAAHRSKPLVVSFTAVFLGGILLLFASPGIVRDRLVKLSGSVESRIVSNDSDRGEGRVAPIDGRIPIFSDTFRMIGDYPITGTGLGNFRYVFPMYRERSVWEAPVLHPESDWLMLVAEAGIPALLALITGIGLSIRSIWPLRSHAYWPLRWALLCAAGATILHGFVDVPAHRVALGWWILVLACLGFQAVPREPKRPSRIQHGVFILAGIGAVALGVFLIRAQWFGCPPSPPTAAFQAQVEIIGLRFDGKPQESIDAAHHFIATYPLADFLHFQLGISLLHLGRDTEAESAFRAQRLINPSAPGVAVDQGAAWMDTDPARAGALWMEAVDRQVRIEHGVSEWRPDALALFRELLKRADAVPTIQEKLLAACSIGPEYTLTWLEQAVPALVAAEFQKLGENAAFTERDRQRFLQLWYHRGNRDQLFAWLAAKPDWQRSARPIALRRLVDAGKFFDAVQSAATGFRINLELPEPGSGQDSAPASAPSSPSAAFEYYWHSGNVVTARRIIDEARAEHPPIDPEVWRLSAAVSARDGRWEAAWQQIERYLRDTHPDSFL